MILGVNSLYFWGAVIIIAVVVEALSLDLSAIWFAVGGAAAMIAAGIQLEVASQLTIFVLFSAALLVLVRPLCRRFLKAGNIPTNADRIIDQIAIVTEQIDNVAGTGAVRVLGNVWSARSMDDALIAAGEKVKILEIRGVKAIVQAINEDTVD